MIRRALIWLLVALALTAYGLVVYSWWLEGNERQVERLQTYDAAR